MSLGTEFMLQNVAFMYVSSIQCVLNKRGDE